MTGRLDGAVVAVTGAAGGMGTSHCVRMAQEGADIVALDLAGTDMDSVADAVGCTGQRCVTATVDVRDRAAMAEAMASASAALGPLTAVVANAGVYDTPGPAWTIATDDWQRALGINLIKTVRSLYHNIDTLFFSKILNSFLQHLIFKVSCISCRCS